MARQPCIECHVRPPSGSRRRCATCLLRHEPVDVQVAACRRRLGMVPVELRRARVKAELWPAGTRWCASCQSFRDLTDMAGGGKGSRCRACASAASHSAMLERTYGLTTAQYDDLLARQGGRCAICRQKPGKKRLAVDHDHVTGAVRGLLCARDNHELLGAGFDSTAKLVAAAYYLAHPPATGTWRSPEDGLDATFTFPTEDARARHPELVAVGGTVRAAATGEDVVCTRPHVMPVGAVKDPDRPGTWRVWVEDGAPAPF